MSYCGWVNDTTGDFFWTRAQKATLSTGTGPTTGMAGIAPNKRKERSMLLFLHRSHYWNRSWLLSLHRNIATTNHRTEGAHCQSDVFIIIVGLREILLSHVWGVDRYLECSYGELKTGHLVEEVIRIEQ